VNYFQADLEFERLKTAAKQPHQSRSEYMQQRLRERTKLPPSDLNNLKVRVDWANTQPGFVKHLPKEMYKPLSDGAYAALDTLDGPLNERTIREKDWKKRKGAVDFDTAMRRAHKAWDPKGYAQSAGGQVAKGKAKVILKEQFPGVSGARLKKAWEAAEHLVGGDPGRRTRSLRLPATTGTQAPTVTFGVGKKTVGRLLNAVMSLRGMGLKFASVGYDPKRVKKVKTRLDAFMKKNKLKGDAVVLAGTSMYLHGLRPTLRDIDVHIPALKGFKSETHRGIEVDAGGRGPKRWVRNAVDIGGVQAQSIPDLIAFKKKMGRPKDLKDIKILKAYLKR
jgi:hypothetical protein